ncbi:putative reverse transcriptase domain-containing protein [Tanacetum coccineum]
MDWLTKYQAVIDCAKKIVRIPFRSGILIFHGDGSRNKRGTRLNFISWLQGRRSICLQGLFTSFCTYYHQGDWRQVDKKQHARCNRSVKIFPKYFPRSLEESSPTDKWNFTTILRLDLKMPSDRYGIMYSQVRHLVCPTTAVVYGPHEPEYAKPYLDQIRNCLIDDILIILRASKSTPRIVSVKDWASPKTPTEIPYAPILALPEGSEDFIVYCDASKKGLGDVLMQREKVISYASRQLKIYEKNILLLVLELGSSCVRSDKIWWKYLLLELRKERDTTVKARPSEVRPTSETIGLLVHPEIPNGSGTISRWILS